MAKEILAHHLQQCTNRNMVPMGVQNFRLCVYPHFPSHSKQLLLNISFDTNICPLRKGCDKININDSWPPEQLPNATLSLATCVKIAGHLCNYQSPTLTTTNCNTDRSCQLKERPNNRPNKMKKRISPFIQIDHHRSLSPSFIISCWMYHEFQK